MRTQRSQCIYKIRILAFLCIFVKDFCAYMDTDMAIYNDIINGQLIIQL